MVNKMRNRGFSIVEVMFAIMILGVGFIMVAAIFPVAIQQSQANVDESTGRSVAMTGAVQTANAMRMLVLPADQAALTTVNAALVAEFHRVAEILPAAATVQQLINTSSIYQGDPRFGWTSFYQCAPPLKPYSLITVALRARNFSEQLDLDHAIGYSGYPLANWQTGNDAYDNAAIRCRANFVAIPGTPGRVAINLGDPNSAQAVDAITEGAILIVRNHPDPTFIGNIYYVSQYDAANAQWELDPKPNANLPPPAPPVEVYLLGRGLRQPNAVWDTNNNPREGVSQVVGVYPMPSNLP